MVRSSGISLTEAKKDAQQKQNKGGKVMFDEKIYSKVLSAEEAQDRDM